MSPQNLYAGASLRTVIVRASMDTYTTENTPDTVGASGVLSTSFTAGSRRRGFVRWDLTPYAGTVQLPRCNLRNTAQIATERTFTMHPVLPAASAWNESSTWNYLTPSTARWPGDAASDGGTDAGGTASGTVYNATPMASWTYTANTPVDTLHSILLDTATVQAWMDDPADNHGATIIQTSSGGVLSYRGDEYATIAFRPTLVMKIGRTYPAIAASPTLAFPQAEGWGRETWNGDGATVIEVTNTNDSGAGSLRAAIDNTSPRIIVFRVAGIITLSNRLLIDDPYCIIAGQTAPGDGIVLKLGAYDASPIRIHTHDVILSGFTVLPGKGNTGPGNYGDSIDAVTIQNGSNCYNIILYHMSLGWGIDGILDIATGGHHITIQNCLIAEGLHMSTHPYSLDPTDPSYQQGHSRPVLFYENAGQAGTTGFITLKDTAITNSHNRMPEVHAVTGRPVDIVNCVIYNWGPGVDVEDGRDWVVMASTRVGNPILNFIGNYFKPGPNSIGTSRERFYGNFPAGMLGDTITAYLSGNTDTVEGAIADMFEGAGGTVNLVAQQQGIMPYTIITAASAYAAIIADGGAGASYRLDQDGNRVNRTYAWRTRVIGDVVNGTGTFINDPDVDLTGWPTPAAGAAYTDTDGDGIPDAYETAHPTHELKNFLWL